MQIHYRFLLSLVLLLFFFTPCVANEKDSFNQLLTNDFPVRAGDRARLTFGNSESQSSKRFTCTIALIRANSITLDLGFEIKTHALSELSKIEIPSGKRRATLGGGLVGAGLGLVTGLLISGSSCEDDYLEDACQVLLPSAGAVLGFAVGATVGFFVKLEAWEEVSINRLELGLAPIRSDTPGLQLSFKF